MLYQRASTHDYLLPGRAFPVWCERKEREDGVSIEVHIRLVREKEIVEAFQDEFKCSFSGNIVGRGSAVIEASPSLRRSHARVQALERARESAARAALAQFDLLTERVRHLASARLEEEVFRRCEKWRKHHASDDRRELALGRVHDIIRNINDGLIVGTRVHAFGSATSGLALHDSDLDVSIVMPGLSTSEQDKGEDDFGAKDCRVNALFALERAACNVHMTNVTVADRARVPVLRYYDPIARMDVDVTVGNDSSIVLSRLIRAHVTHDARVWSVCMLVKDWAKYRGISGTARKFINPLAWSVMVIFFLQHVARPRVADLYHVRRRGPDAGGDPAQACIVRMGWKTHRGDGRSVTTASELLTQFFHFFGYEFDFKSEAISVNFNSRCTVVDLLGRNSSSALFVEQPLHFRENIVSYVDHDNMRLTIEELRRAARMCVADGRLNNIISPPDED